MRVSLTAYFKTQPLPPLIGFLVLALAPHCGRLPLWLCAWCVCGWSYALLAERYGWAPLHGFLKLIITLAGMALVISSYGYFMGREAGTAMLVLLLGLKPLEIRSRRDRMVTLFLACFLILANLLFSQSLLMALYLLLAAQSLQMLLMHTNQPGLAWRSLWRTSGSVVVQALPLMLIAFMLFPRLPGALFRLPQDQQARSGLSDTLSPGDISRLIPDQSIALRADFTGRIPDFSERYWRAIVLWHFDGRTWHAASPEALRLPAEAPQTAPRGDYHYTLLLEPHQSKYGVALDLPVWVAAGAQLQRDATLRLSSELNTRGRFEIISVRSPDSGELLPDERAAGLHLPEGSNPRSQALARRWAAEQSPAGVVTTVLNWFRQEPFYYTLEPPLLPGPHRIDDFLGLNFDLGSRRGYCEHYASAMALLMRAAGIPARIVTGYQGGSVNPLGQFVTVRQSDAHAWVEIALPGEGWRRVDPTAAVAPDRIERGMEAGLPFDEIAQLRGALYSGPAAALLQRLGVYRDAANHFWHSRVLDYSYQRQQRFLSRLGLQLQHWTDLFRTLMLLLVVVGSTFVALLLWYYRPRRTFAEPARRYYQRFIHKLRKAGIPVHAGEGPRTLARKVTAAYPHAAPAVDAITQCYIQLRYARQHSQHKDLQCLKKLTGNFKLHTLHSENR